MRRHHQEVKCNSCEYKTKNEYELAEHKKQHKKMFTCKFWRQGRCNNQDNCAFKHELIQCKFGLSCKRGLSCKFEHPDNGNRSPPGRTNRQNNNQWNNPAFGSQSAYNASFPFLVQAMWQMASRNRGM